MKPHRVPLSVLQPYDDLSDWGDEGWRHRQTTTPRAYYAALRAHMQTNGSIEPLEVGFLHGEGSRLFVFNGQHRLQIARELGWSDIEVVQSDAEDALDVDWSTLPPAQVRA